MTAILAAMRRIYPGPPPESIGSDSNRGKPRIRHRFRMHQMSKLADALSDARCRTGVVRVAIHCDRQAREAHLGCPRRSFIHAEAAGTEDDELRLAGKNLLPGGGIRGFAGPAENVCAAGGFDHLRKPVTGAERRLNPLREEDGAAGEGPPPSGPVLDRREQSVFGLLRAVWHA